LIVAGPAGRGKGRKRASGGREERGSEEVGNEGGRKRGKARLVAGRLRPEQMHTPCCCRDAPCPSTPQRAAAIIVAAHITLGCKDLEEDRGRSTEEREGRKEWAWTIRPQCLRCLRNTTVVTTVVKSQKLEFEKYFYCYCYYHYCLFHTYQLYSSQRTTMSTSSQEQLLRYQDFFVTRGKIMYLRCGVPQNNSTK
jgi:hypothetical protein